MTEKLVLHIEIPEFNTAEWRDVILQVFPDMEDDFDELLLDDLLDNYVREKVHVVFCTLPGEKSTNDDFEVHVKRGRIVGAELLPLGD